MPRGKVAILRGVGEAGWAGGFLEGPFVPRRGYMAAGAQVSHRRWRRTAGGGRRPQRPIGPLREAGPARRSEAALRAVSDAESEFVARGRRAPDLAGTKFSPSPRHQITAIFKPSACKFDVRSPTSSFETPPATPISSV